MCAVGMAQFTRIAGKDDPGKVHSRDAGTEVGRERALVEKAQDLGRCNQDQESERRGRREEAAAGQWARPGGEALESLSQGRKGTE